MRSTRRWSRKQRVLGQYRRFCAGLCCVLALVWLLPGMALAQTTATPTPAIQRLNIQVMPEFDDARVLVIVQGRLAANVTLPQSLTFRLPQGAQVNQMAIINMRDGSLTSRPYEVTNDPTDSRWSLATYTIDSAHFFFEYYFNPLESNPEKSFTFTVSSLQPVADLLLEVQQPRLAEAFATTPPTSAERLDKYGLTLYQLPVGALGVGEETAVTIRYTKSDPTPSVPRSKTEPEVAATITNATIPLWAVGALVTAVGGGIAGFSWLRARPRQPITTPSPGSGCCPQCGARQRADSRYCHVCGANL